MGVEPAEHRKPMRISVRSRAGSNGSEPCSLCLGRCSLRVVDILERGELPDARRFQVRVTDGRRFVLRHQPAMDRWELAAVYAPQKRKSPTPFEIGLARLRLVWRLSQF
jgi:hypothetical protein